MQDGVAALIKTLSPKFIAGGFMGLPLTAVIGPTAGILALGGIGVACFIGLNAAVQSMQRHQEPATTAAVPPL